MVRVLGAAVLLSLLSCGDEREAFTCESYAAAVCDWKAACAGDFDDGDTRRCRTDQAMDCQNGAFVDYDGCADALENTGCQDYPTIPDACAPRGSW